MPGDNFCRGFEKRAISIDKATSLIHKGLRVPAYVMMGTGAGYLGRAAFEDPNKPTKEKTTRDDVIAYLPAIGAAAGLGAGAAQFLPNLTGLLKVSSLRKDVVLKPHQERALARLDENNGSLLVAHATGSGKTLTGIAAFEKLKEEGKANRALVVVPAALRDNFSNSGVKKFTNSTVAVYGPKNEQNSLNIGDKSKAHYNVVSYELFREHGDKLIEDTGADTLIMDEIHRVRGDEGVTYAKLRDLRPKFKQAITLTGSIVNNEPAEVVPLLDVTFGPSGHKLVNKSFFDKLFVDKKALTTGFMGSGKVVIQKDLKNTGPLSNYLGGKIDYVPHDHPTLEKDLPKKNVTDVVVHMSEEQRDLYNYTMGSVDPILRWKIRNNIPINQNEAKGAFSQLLQARQVSTDPAVLSEKLRGKNPMEYSPKIRAIVNDAKAHLESSPENKTVIYGNLIHGQLDGIEKALHQEKVPFVKFYGTGQEGVTQKTRTQAIADFQNGKSRVLLISGAGAEGLDLKNTNLIQMVEGHYNPERIQQAESRIRRMGSFANKPLDERKVEVRRYFAKPEPTKFGKVMESVGKLWGASGDEGIDRWVYSIAKRKDELNSQFRDVLNKNQFEKRAIGAMFGHGYLIGNSIGGLVGAIPTYFMGDAADKEVEAALKQKLLDKGYESLAQKRHYEKILNESGIAGKIQDANVGMEWLSAGGALALGTLQPGAYLDKVFPAHLDGLGSGAAIGFGTGVVAPVLKEFAKKKILSAAVANNAGKDLDIGIDRYLKKLRSKAERKYVGSKGYIREYETKKELGIDPAM